MVMRLPIFQVGCFSACIWSHRGQQFTRRIAERAAGGRENQARDGAAIPRPQALMRLPLCSLSTWDPTRLRISARRIHDQLAARNQHFLIRQPDSFALPDSRICRFQSGDSHDG